MKCKRCKENEILDDLYCEKCWDDYDVYCGICNEDYFDEESFFPPCNHLAFDGDMGYFGSGYLDSDTKEICKKAVQGLFAILPGQIKKLCIQELKDNRFDVELHILYQLKNIDYKLWNRLTDINIGDIGFSGSDATEEEKIAVNWLSTLGKDTPDANKETIAWIKDLIV